MKSERWYSGDQLIHREWSDDGKHCLTFSTDRWLEVKKERERLGLPHIENAQELSDHPLIGRRLYNKKNNKIYNIEKVSDVWCFGRYINLLIENNRSHAYVWIDYTEGIGHEDVFKNAMSDYLNTYKLMEE